MDNFYNTVLESIDRATRGSTGKYSVEQDPAIRSDVYNLTPKEYAAKYPKLDQQGKEDLVRSKAQEQDLNLSDRQVKYATGKNANVLDGLIRGTGTGLGHLSGFIDSAVSGDLLQGKFKNRSPKAIKKFLDATQGLTEDEIYNKRNVVGGQAQESANLSAAIPGLLAEAVPSTAAAYAAFPFAAAEGAAASLPLAARAGIFGLTNAATGIPLSVGQSADEQGNINAGEFAQSAAIDLGIGSALPVVGSAFGKLFKNKNMFRKISKQNKQDTQNIENVVNSKRDKALNELQQMEMKQQQFNEQNSIIKNQQDQVARQFEKENFVDNSNGARIINDEVINTPEYSQGKNIISESIQNLTRDNQEISDDLVKAIYRDLDPEDISNLGKARILKQQRDSMASRLQQNLDGGMNNTQDAATYFKGIRESLDTIDNEIKNLGVDNINKKLFNAFDSVTKPKNIENLDTAKNVSIKNLDNENKFVVDNYGAKEKEAKALLPNPEAKVGAEPKKPATDLVPTKFTGKSKLKATVDDIVAGKMNADSTLTKQQAKTAVKQDLDRLKALRSEADKAVNQVEKDNLLQQAGKLESELKTLGTRGYKSKIRLDKETKQLKFKGVDSKVSNTKYEPQKLFDLDTVNKQAAETAAKKLASENPLLKSLKEGKTKTDLQKLRQDRIERYKAGGVFKSTKPLDIDEAKAFEPAFKEKYDSLKEKKYKQYVDENIKDYNLNDKQLLAKLRTGFKDTEKVNEAFSKSPEFKDKFELFKDKPYKDFIKSNINKYDLKDKQLWAKLRQDFNASRSKIQPDSALGKKNIKKLEAGDPKTVKEAINDINSQAKSRFKEVKTKARTKCK
jgi:hypothetical protein